MSGPTIDPEVAAALETMGAEETIDVLVYPQGLPGQALRGFLDARASTDTVRYNVLDFAGCIVVRAPKRIVLELASHAAVARIAANPTFRAGG